MQTIGRFAPSPTGSLHFGSLVAATASYLAARSECGRWLLRIEDLDKPREQVGAAAHIIQTLLALGFEWDGEILYQSQRLNAYQDALQHLSSHIYPCTCSRKAIQQAGQTGALGLIYAGTCRAKTPLPAPQQQYALRLRTDDSLTGFEDAIQGYYAQRLANEVGDFVIRRADGLFAYQLAVVVDDAFQGVNQIVRGADLLDNTPRQIYLQRLLGFPTPHYAHVPLAVDQDGQKLSKQNFAPSIDRTASVQNVVAALQFLGQQPPRANDIASLTELWDWAIANWHIQNVPCTLTQPIPAL